jgi:hypothetical protein
MLLGVVGPVGAQIKYQFVVTTTVLPPVNPYIQSAFANPVGGINVMVRNTTDTFYDSYVPIIGKLQRLSPSGFTIERNAQSVGQGPYIPLPGPLQARSLTYEELDGAFGNFYSQNLNVSGISLNAIRDSISGVVKLPPGQYRICFYLMNPNFKQAMSDPNQGCAFFNICKIDPPQFTRPNSNFSIGSNITVIQDASPVNFTWTPPLAACGSPGPVNYELEIRELFNNQSVTDALNNPIVFDKMAIPSPAFLLDTRVYPNVLQPGKRYVVRVRAATINPASLVSIDNNGYSRPEAFQFGSENAVTPNIGGSIPSYYLPLEERKSVFWSDYEKRDGKDTLIPVAEYIAYKLMQQGIAYSQDAIDLLVAYNPVLKDAKTVKLKQPAEFPGLPEITDQDRHLFDASYVADMQPNSGETARFRRLLDSLRISSRQQKMPDRASSGIAALISDLERWKENAATANSVSLSFINASLSELLFVIRSLQNNLSNNEYNHLLDIIYDVKALTITVSPGPSPHGFNHRPDGGYVSWASYKEYSSGVDVMGGDGKYFALEPLMPVDVIVYRPAPPPAQAITNAPDLKGVFRIFYTSRTLYNNKNPEINAKSPGPLASTTQVSLPGYLKYKFWTLNMINQKQTLAQDVDIAEIAAASRKEGVKGKKVTVVLKVE